MPRKIIKPDAIHQDLIETIPTRETESALATALIGASYVEKALIALLSGFFIEGSQTANHILSEKGFLGELSKCAQLAYCVGLISKLAFKNIGLIGQIRNEFAHNHLPIDFDDPAVATLCDELKPMIIKIGIEKFDTVVEEKLKGWKNETRRDRFYISANQVYLSLYKSAKNIEHRTSPADEH